MTILTPETAKDVVEARTEIKIGGLVVQSTKNAVNKGINMTLYGQGGAGKTTLPSVLQDTEFGPILYQTAESGITAIQHLDVPYVAIAKWEDLENTLREFKAHPDLPYKSTVLDNLSEMLDKCIRSVASDGKPTQPQWNDITNKMLTLIRGWRDLTTTRDLNVFFIAWDADEKDDVGFIKKDINFTPALRKAYPGIVDSVGWISAPDGHPEMRKLSFAPGRKTIAKFRRAPTSNAMKIPFDIFYKVDNLPLYDIIKTIKFDNEWPAAKYPAPSGGTTA